MTLPADLAMQYVSCPECATKYVRGHHRVGDVRLCFCCSTIYKMPPFGEPATRATVEEFNRGSGRPSGEEWLAGRRG